MIKKFPRDYSSPIVRAKFERKLKEIVAKKMNKEQFYDEAKEFIIEVCQAIVKNGKLKEIKNNQLDMKCPICKNNLLEMGKVYKCNNNDCKFFIIKQGKFAKIDLDKLQKLLNNEKVEFEKVILQLDLENPYFIKTEWKEKKENLIETAKTYRLGDKYIFKMFRNHLITKKQAERLLNGEEVKLSLKSKNGNKYQVIAKTKGEGVIDVEFRD